MSTQYTREEREARWRASRAALGALYAWSQSGEPLAGLALRLGRVMPSPPQTPGELAECAELTDIITSIYESDRSPAGVRKAVISHVRQWRPDGCRI